MSAVFIFHHFIFWFYLFALWCTISTLNWGNKKLLSPTQHVAVKCTMSLWVRKTLPGFTEFCFSRICKEHRSLLCLGHPYGYSVRFRMITNGEKKIQDGQKSASLRHTKYLSLCVQVAFQYPRLLHCEFVALSSWQIKYHHWLVEVRMHKSCMLVKSHAFQSVISTSLLFSPTDGKMYYDSTKTE